MTKEQVSAIFLLAGLPTTDLHKLANCYWPDAPDYDEIRRANPWWLVITPAGPIKIGWRKRVISIEWGGTPIRKVITADDVTKGDDHVHAYGYAKAVEHLTAFRREWERYVYLAEHPVTADATGDVP